MNDAETDSEHSVPEQPSDAVAEPAPSIEATVIEATAPGESSAGGNQAEPVPDATPDEQTTNDTGSTRTRASLTSTDLNLMGSVQVKLTLNVGSKSMAIADVLELERGSVVTLNRREHDPLDVLINGVVFARGEVVRTGDYYGLRILEIL